MKKKGGIEGIDRVVQGLNGKLREYEMNGTRGLRNAANFIHRQSEKVPPKVPVDTGNLRHSWFINTLMWKKNNRSIVEFGFSANYAAFVHEMVGADFSSPRMLPDRTHGTKSKSKGLYTPRKGAGAKYLEAHMKRNVFKILKIIRGEMTSSGRLIN